MKLSDIILQFENDLLKRYQGRLLPSHYHALTAMKRCRTALATKMQVDCNHCQHSQLMPHSCGHRNCPHCQHHESQRWILRQRQKQVRARYFMVTFTLPAQLRALAWQHQQTLYAALMQCAWQTLSTFAQNDKALKGVPGATMVLHTHARNLDYHPHVHVLIPAAAIDAQRCWRIKRNKKQKDYLFNQKAMARVFRGKLIAAIKEQGLSLPSTLPTEWIVHCKSVGSGDKAVIYLGRYLYRGVIAEKNILCCKNGQVTYRYQSSQTKRWEVKTCDGAEFLWRLLQHILPKGFQRARNYGFLHSNRKALLTIVQWMLAVRIFKREQLLERKAIHCPHCQNPMQITRRCIYPSPMQQPVQQE